MYELQQAEGGVMGKRDVNGLVECPNCTHTMQITSRLQRQLESGASYVKIRCAACVNQFMVSINSAGQFDSELVKQTQFINNSFAGVL